VRCEVKQERVVGGRCLGTREGEVYDGMGWDGMIWFDRI